MKLNKPSVNKVNIVTHNFSRIMFFFRGLVLSLVPRFLLNNYSMKLIKTSGCVSNS